MAISKNGMMIFKKFAFKNKMSVAPMRAPINVKTMPTKHSL